MNSERVEVHRNLKNSTKQHVQHNFRCEKDDGNLKSARQTTE